MYQPNVPMALAFIRFFVFPASMGFALIELIAELQSKQLNVIFS